MAATDSARVMIFMGSDSDFPVLKGCCEMLKRFGVPFEAHVCSAHRSPAQAVRYATEAKERGVEVIIAAAGMAAHLGGVLAAHTVLPVIGVPMPGGMLDGLDALLSTVQMPPGVPVATVGVGKAGAKNAAILAVQMMAIHDKALADQLADFRAEQTEGVGTKDQALQSEVNSL